LAKAPEKPAKSASQPESIESDELAQEIAKRIGNLIPQGQKAQVVAQVVSLVSEERFSGPIAHPRHLREYEDICPGAADRIIRMAEQSLAHGQSVQKSALNADIADMQAGRRYGFWALISLIIAASCATYFGHELIAGAFLGAGVLGVIGQLIQGSSSKNQE
jgi:uncharacterized membrane protein